jgi:uncharacterized protein (DUF488 family)
MLLLSIGHSNHPIGKFIELAKSAGVEEIADIRSIPASRFCPQFNRANLEKSLSKAGIGYVYLGDALGGRQKNMKLPNVKSSGGQMPDYSAMARIGAFQKGIDALLDEAKNKRVAMMCAERDPKDCHRFHLVGKFLARKKIGVDHILSDGRIETQEQVEARAEPRKSGDLFG